jgi:hypothetical protein
MNNIVGTYGDCEDVRQCFQIVLNENKTFKYYINDYVAGKGVVCGTWQSNNDTLFLDIALPEREKPTVLLYTEDTIEKKKLVLRTTELDSLPLSKATVIINESIKLESNSEGVVYVGVDKVERLEISYFNLLSDTVFNIEHEDDINVFELNIPLSAGIELIYKQPNKWWIEDSTLIPYWLEGQEYRLRRDRAIKKIPQRKTLPQLTGVYKTSNCE